MTPTSPEVRKNFDEWIEQLRAVVVADDRVVGLAVMGSTAHRHRVDEWSDHDFALVTVEGAQDYFRHDLSWLPRDGSIALSAVEDHGGVKVVYDDGHVLEFGIASIDELRTWATNAVDVLYDIGGVADALANPVELAKPSTSDDARDIALLCTLVLIGVGRARRGELLSAGQIVRAEALAHLLAVLARRLPSDLTVLDSLDPRRRFELVHPSIGARLAAALEKDVEAAGRELLLIAEETLEPGWQGFPRRGLAAVRTRLGWG